MTGTARQCRAEASRWNSAPVTQTVGVSFRDAAGLARWPGHTRPTPGAARCEGGGPSAAAPGGVPQADPAEGSGGGDSLKQCWRRNPKAAGNSNYPIGHDRRPKDPAPTAEWAGPRRGSGETGQREENSPGRSTSSAGSAPGPAAARSATVGAV